LSRLPQQTDATRKLLLQALQDKADDVRWQAALAIGKAGWNNAQSRAALLGSLNDTNELVAAAAVYALVQLGDTNSVASLLAKLKVRLQLPTSASEELQPQALAIFQGTRGEENHADRILDVDGLAWRVAATVPVTVQKWATMRLPPRPFDMPMHNYNLADALIEALGNLGYAPAADELFKLRGTDYDAEATRALNKLAPDRLTNELLAAAKDKQIDSYLREQALVTLCNISATNCVRDIVPLLDDATPIVYSRPLPGLEWRVCDRAATTIAVLLGWESRMLPIYVSPEQREETMTRVREWGKSAP
jgi:HEAT repeat protein